MSDLIVRAELLERMGLADAVKYGNKDAEQQYRSYSTWMSYEIADAIWDAPAVNRWIPVEDALPEKDKSYITYAETTKYCNHNEIPEELRINILYFNGEEWYDEECRYYNVTHYMPLPEPPKEDEA